MAVFNGGSQIVARTEMMARCYSELQHPVNDGTTHVLFSSLDFIGKLVVLVPGPRRHLVRYHGALAPMLASAL